MNFSKKEFVKYLFIAMGSADEVAVELEFCRDLGYVEVKMNMKYWQIELIRLGVN